MGFYLKTSTGSPALRFLQQTVPEARTSEPQNETSLYVLVLTLETTNFIEFQLKAFK